METDAAVDKISDFQFLSTAAWKSLLPFHTVPTGSAAMNLKQQTGQIICYKNRTFLFATDTANSLLIHC